MRVLLLQYSLSGETHKATEEFTRGLQDECHNDNLEICHQTIQLKPAFAFPWRFWAFFDVMPETVVTTSPWRQKKYRVVEPEASASKEKPFDLVILGWQTWYLSPSLPVQLALEDPKYQELLSHCKNVVLVGTHRNMWHHASQTLCQSLSLQKLKLVGTINFVQSSAFLASVVQTLQRQLQGKPGLQTTAQQDAYQEGRKFAQHYRSQETATIYQGGKPPNKALAFCEDVWFPCKRAAAKIMSVFAPGSLGRKVVSLLYIPVLLSAIVGLAPPILLVGSLAGLQNKGSGSSSGSGNEKKED